MGTPIKELARRDVSQLDKELAKRDVTPAQLRAIIDTVKNPQIEKPGRRSHRFGKKSVRFGLCSDTHFGSKFANLDALTAFYARLDAEGVKRCYHAGDITEGYDRRKGHAFECDLHGADEQVDGVCRLYPRLNKGKGKTYFITGDHDGWHKESGGVSVGRMISQRREDLVHIGDCAAKIELADNVTLELVHPSKGTSYAISYQIQKLIEAIPGGAKPSILAVGHYHKAEQIFYRNIHAFQTGCMQTQTGWMRRNNLAAHVAGWIVEACFTSNGTIDKIKSELVPFYE